MKKLATLILFVFCISTGIGQTDFQSIIGKNYPQRHKFLLSQFHIPIHDLDSTVLFERVHRMEKAAVEQKDEELVLECEFIRLNYLSSPNSAAYIRGIFPFIEKVDQLGVKQLKVRARQSLANHYFEHKKYGKAMDYFEQSYELLKGINPKELPDKQEMLYNIAFAYYRIGYYNTSLKFLNLASEISNNYYPTLPLNILNIQGLIHQKLNDTEQVVETYEFLIVKAAELENDTWVQVGRNNLARHFLVNKEFIKAADFLNKGTFNVKDELVELPILIERETILYEIQSSLGLQSQLIQTANRINSLVQNSNVVTVPVVYKALALLAAEKKDYQKSNYYLELALRMVEDQQIEMEWRLRQQADDKESVERYFRQQEQLNNEKALSKFILVSALIIIILLFAIAGGFIKRQRTLFKNQQLEAEIEKIRIKEELNNAQTELEQMTNFLLSKNKELNSYREELAKIEGSNTSDIVLLEKARHLNDLLSKPILTEENWQQFKRSFEGVHVDFFHRLNLKLPGLTPAEIRYLVLRKLHLSRNEIADLLGISPDSIRQYRHRILKKYQLKSDEELELIIQEI